MGLRPYQQNGIDEIRDSFAVANRRVLYQLPTGGGKSKVLSHIVKSAYDKGSRVMMLAHRKELIYQLRGHVEGEGLQAGVIMAGHDFTSHRIQVASIQTLTRRLGYPLWDNSEWHPQLILTDECHHAKAASYQSVYNRFPNARLLGVTATPIRTDGKGLGDVFDDMVCGPQIHELVSAGFLCSPKYFCSGNVMGDRKVGRVAGDYNKRELGQAVSETRLEGNLVREWFAHAEGLQTIVFAVNVEHSQRIVNEYLAVNVPAAHLDHHSSPEHRAQVLADFAVGKIKILSNVGLVTEGFDVPATACVQLARPTQSLGLYYQMVGRALRTAPDKPEAIILDHAGCYLAHGNVLTPYHWKLHPTPEKEPQPDWLDDGQEPREATTPKERIVTHDGREILVEVGFDFGDAWANELSRLNRLAQERSYKPGWVARQMQERFDDMDLAQYRILARSCGYHYQWADRQMAKASDERVAA